MRHLLYFLSGGNFAGARGGKDRKKPGFCAILNSRKEG
ncbi:hypothetical protein HMPREF1039_0601 [Megasphaera lornae]|uniref:Uncharacterized protein n=1 Tax=Megasphaera lornae TaxID=1000568 RepID=D3LUL6_9FIRM|nr:hypothetical protein HMPREF0889_1562 [Megasphaera genomosp. type_1 str. 28L]EGL35118.1 hypothetical protein HMPREF1039_0601 [Megasphaera lornae]